MPVRRLPADQTYDLVVIGSGFGALFFLGMSGAGGVARRGSRAPGPAARASTIRPVRAPGCGRAPSGCRRRRQ